MKYNKITPTILKKIQDIIGEQYVLFDTDSLKNYGHDETEDLVFLPEVVVKPRTAKEISEILKIANAELIPVTPRGAGTGLSGCALPIHSGIILSMERFNQILQIDERNLQATVEPGVINEAFQNAVKELGLFYPPDPASKGSCFLGGN
ncbi:MAG TPA: FAD-binding oxidoreductase, partial [Bacteroidia bacterium]|nr:FAD-binding oxidoreductase [Bacteroidia bacterium]